MKALSKVYFKRLLRTCLEVGAIDKETGRQPESGHADPIAACNQSGAALSYAMTQRSEGYGSQLG
jgi:hypothetical protein